VGRFELDASGSGHGPVAGYCENSNGPTTLKMEAARSS